MRCSFTRYPLLPRMEIVTVSLGGQVVNGGSPCAATRSGRPASGYLEDGGTIENAQAIAAPNRRERRHFTIVRAMISRSMRWRGLRFEATRPFRPTTDFSGHKQGEFIHPP